MVSNCDADRDLSPESESAFSSDTAFFLAGLSASLWGLVGAFVVFSAVVRLVFGCAGRASRSLRAGSTTASSATEAGGSPDGRPMPVVVLMGGKKLGVLWASGLSSGAGGESDSSGDPESSRILGSVGAKDSGTRYISRFLSSKSDLLRTGAARWSWCYGRRRRF